MSTKLKYLLFTLLICYLTSTANNPTQTKLDSLKNILKNSESTNKEKPRLLFNLSLEEYQRQHYPEAINYANQALEAFKTIGDREKEAKTLEILGIYYAEFSDYQNSIKYLLKALTIAEERNNQESIHSKKFNIGTTFIEAGNYSKGIDFIKSSIKYYENPKTKNIAFIVAGYANLGVAYSGMEILDSAMFYYQTAANIARQENFTQQIGAPLLNIGEIHLKNNNIQKAITHYEQALEAFKISNDIKGIWHTNYGIASAYAKQNKITKAISLFEEVIPHFEETNDLNYLAKSLTVLSAIYEKENNPNLALKYKKKLLTVKDSISKSEIINKMADLELQYRIKKLQEENQAKIELLKQEKKITSLRWYGATSILVIIIILIITLYKKNKTQKKLVETRLQNTELEQLKLKNELNYRNKELENFALHIVQKNDFISDIKSKLKKLKNNASEKNNEEIKKLNILINQSLRTNKELEKFRERVDDVNSHFFNLLTNNYPNLTEKEKRLCALLKLNLSSKEIATLNNISEGAVTMARYRLRKKIGLKTDESLTELFHKLG